MSGISRASHYRSKAGLAALAQCAVPPSKARKRQNKPCWGEAEKQLVLAIPLIVLPPKKPTCNGGVERGNRTFREEFYFQPNLLADTITAMRHELQKAVTKYNTYRPHRALNGITPTAYPQTYPNGAKPGSQTA